MRVRCLPAEFRYRTNFILETLLDFVTTAWITEHATKHFPGENLSLPLIYRCKKHLFGATIFILMISDSVVAIIDFWKLTSWTSANAPQSMSLFCTNDGLAPSPSKVKFSISKYCGRVTGLKWCKVQTTYSPVGCLGLRNFIYCALMCVGEMI